MFCNINIKKISQYFQLSIKLVAKVLHTFLMSVVVAHTSNLIYFHFGHMAYYHSLQYGHLYYFYIETVWLAVICVSGLRMYMEAAFTNPGKLKDFEIPLEMDELRDIEDGDDEAEFHSCGFCNVIKVWYSHHCMVCGTCVVRMDHHCPWITNCVGYYNHRFFTLLPFYGLTGHSHMWLRFMSFWELLEGPPAYENFVYFLITGFTMFTATFFFSYFVMTVKGWTVIESAERFAMIRKRVSLSIFKTVSN